MRPNKRHRRSQGSRQHIVTSDVLISTSGHPYIRTLATVASLTLIHLPQAETLSYAINNEMIFITSRRAKQWETWHTPCGREEGLETDDLLRLPFSLPLQVTLRVRGVVSGRRLTPPVTDSLTTPLSDTLLPLPKILPRTTLTSP